MKINKDELTRSICRDSFYEFVKEFWPTVSTEKPVWNWHVEYLCNQIQEITERVFKGLTKEHDLVCNVSPGTTKSTIFSVMLPAWAWTRMPSCRFICVSYAYSLAMDLSRKSRDVIKSEKYTRLFPRIFLREDQDSKGYFINNKLGDRLAVGVGGSVMGFHAHIIVIDDPINPKQALSDAMLKEANDFMTETIPSRKVDKRITPTILVMQRLAENDPTGERLTRGKDSPVKRICLPAELSEDVFPVELKSKYVDGLMDPIRLNRKVLAEALEDLKEMGYAGQYQQSPVPRGGGMFHTNELKYDIPPQHFQRVMRYWDKAASMGTGCYSVGVKIAIDNGNRIWILDVVRIQLDSYRREELILKTARQDGRHIEIGIEQEGGGGGKESAESTVRNLRGFTVRVHKVSKSDGDKVMRADPFSSQVNAGNVYMIKAPWNEAYINELKHFPRSRYKDQVDASSGGFFYLSTPMIVVGGL